MRYLILTLMLAGAFAGEVVLPTEVTSALTKYETTIKEAETKLAKVKMEASYAACLELNKALQVATKRGNLEQALAIKAKRDALMPEVDLLGVEVGAADTALRFKTYTIVDAIFGASGQTVSAMAFARELVKGKLTVTASKIGADPAPNARKTLTLTIVNARGIKKTLVVPENQEIDLDEVLK